MSRWEGIRDSFLGVEMCFQVGLETLSLQSLHIIRLASWTCCLLKVCLVQWDTCRNPWVNQILTTTDAPRPCDCQSCERGIRRAKSVENLSALNSSKSFKFGSGSLVCVYSWPLGWLLFKSPGRLVGEIVRQQRFISWKSCHTENLETWISFLGIEVLNRILLGFLPIYK